VSRSPSAAGARRPLLWLATACLPLALLLALEAALRLAGFGAELQLFLDSPTQPGYREIDPEVSRRFIVDPQVPLLTKPDPIYFAARKPADGLRLFVQGESTAAGFPYGRFASLAGMLQQRLGDTFPDRPVEVVSTAMSAVNSYTLLDFADEILREQPDAILIYTGHNEYLGLLGVGSTYSAGRSRALTLAFLELRGVRIFQLLQYGFATARRGLSPAAQDPGAESESLMVQVAREKEIPLGSELYERGLAQLRANLRALLSKYRAAGVPVLIGTLASNERDQPPFAGRAPAGLPAEESADAWYARARSLEAEGDLAGARRAYLEAKDRDLLRFRAPEAVNAILRELAAEQGALLVDVQAAFAREARGGIIGSELVLEHLHPNVWGYFVLADAFYDALREAGLLGSWENAVPDAVAWRRQPVSLVERLAGERRIDVLEAHWPFQPEGAPVRLPEPRPHNRLERIALRMADQELSWTAAMQQALEIHERRGEREEAARIAVNLAATYPLAPSAHAVAGRWLLELGRAAEAERRFARAALLAPDKELYRLGLAEASRAALNARQR
jgi:lysophospholipase L1-like esterase